LKNTIRPLAASSLKLNQEPHRKTIIPETLKRMSNPQPSDENKILPQKAISKN
jgi:hypothetical protein